MTKVTSSRKRNANCANARYSTGPRTRAGKSRSRLNALTHGAFLTCDVLISTGDGKENQAEFDQSLAGLVEDWQPVGATEEMLVRQIAITYWRQRRMLKCETGAIRRRLDAVTSKEMRRRERAAGQDIRFERVDELQETSRGLDYLIASVENLTPASQRGRTKVAEVDLQWLAKYLGWDMEGRTTISQDWFEDELKELRERRERVLAEEALALDAKKARLALPTSKTADLIMRYEAHGRRQLKFLFDQLEALQRRRRDRMATDADEWIDEAGVNSEPTSPAAVGLETGDIVPRSAPAVPGTNGSDPTADAGSTAEASTPAPMGPNGARASSSPS